MSWRPTGGPAGFRATGSRSMVAAPAADTGPTSPSGARTPGSSSSCCTSGRSHAVYPNDAGDVAFGPHQFAFAAYRRGLFLTDLNGPERLVMRGRGLYPYDFTQSGQLLVVSAGRVDVLGRDGRLLRGYRYRQTNGLAFDPRRETFYFVTPDGTLAAAQGTSLRLVSRLDGIEG